MLSPPCSPPTLSSLQLLPPWRFLECVSVGLSEWVWGGGNKKGVFLWAARIGQTFFENGPLSKGLLVGSQTDRHTGTPA